ncbi:MAG: hypothetical protein IJH54_07750 [Clostridia bacterium]|nr:hypothetical protein [Clostridia bacterium]
MRPKLRLDELNKALLITAGASYLLSFVLNRYAGASTLFRLLFAAALIFLGIRLFAGHPDKRYAENMKFLTYLTAVKDFFGKTFRRTGASQRPASSSASGGLLDKWKQQWHEYRTYRYLICPQCSQRLRVPRGKGKIRVTCTKCRNQFVAKS